MTEAHGQPDSFDLDAYLDGTLGDQERDKMSAISVLATSFNPRSICKHGSMRH